MRMQPEARFKHRLVDSFEKHVPGGWYTYIVKGPGMKDGLPDLLFGQQRSKLLWVEAKRPNGRNRGSQDLMIARLILSDQRVIRIKPDGPKGVLWGTNDYITPMMLGRAFWSNFFAIQP